MTEHPRDNFTRLLMSNLDGEKDKQISSLMQALDFIEKKSDVPDNRADVLSWAAMLHSRIRDINLLAKGCIAAVSEAGKP